MSMFKDYFKFIDNKFPFPCVSAFSVCLQQLPPADPGLFCHSQWQGVTSNLHLPFVTFISIKFSSTLKKNQTWFASNPGEQKLHSPERSVQMLPLIDLNMGSFLILADFYSHLMAKCIVRYRCSMYLYYYCNLYYCHCFYIIHCIFIIAFRKITYLMWKSFQFSVIELVLEPNSSHS